MGEISHRSRRLGPLPAVNGRLSVVVSRVSLLATAATFLAASVAGIELGMRVQAGIYLFGMVALNLPHGGYEHFNNIRQRGLTFQWRYVAAYWR